MLSYFYLPNMAKSPRFVPLVAVLYASLLFSCTLGNDSSDEGGTQTWMAENLNYNISGSRCYDNDPANCAIYGRLYNWATAMALPPSCNSSVCASLIFENHRGICPKGWHIPSNDDWRVLTKFVGKNAGTQLKATSGWNSYEGISSGEDIYDFAALPGGWGDSVNEGYGKSYFHSIRCLKD